MPDFTSWADRFLTPRDRTTATHELASRADAIEILEALFTGPERSAPGQRSDAQGVVLDCAFVTAKLLGRRAKPLERHLRMGASRRHIHAVEALGWLGELDPASIEALAAIVAELDLPAHDWNIASEAAASLVRYGAAEHAAVSRVIVASQRAASCFNTARELIRRNP